MTTAAIGAVGAAIALARHLRAHTCRTTDDSNQAAEATPQCLATNNEHPQPGDVTHNLCTAHFAELALKERAAGTDDTHPDAANCYFAVDSDDLRTDKLEDYAAAVLPAGSSLPPPASSATATYLTDHQHQQEDATRAPILTTTTTTTTHGSTISTPSATPPTTTTLSPEDNTVAGEDPAADDTQPCTTDAAVDSGETLYFTAFNPTIHRRCETSRNEASGATAQEPKSHMFEIDPSSLSVNESRVIGRGGSAIVYEGTLLCAGMHLPVAVKQLTVADETHMLREELKVLSVTTALCNRTCRLLGICTRSERLCLVTKLYKCSLAQALLAEPERKPPLIRTLELAAELCVGLAELHRARIVHQDVKPSNLLLDNSGNLIIADFGISYCLSTICSRCLPPNAIGTPHYMAPEAFDPAEFGGITAATDIWSMGCCVLEMLQGAPPWAGMRLSQISRQVCDKRRTPFIEPDISAPLDALLRRCFSEACLRPTANDAATRFAHFRAELLVPEWTVDYDLDEPCESSEPSAASLSYEPYEPYVPHTDSTPPTWLRDASKILHESQVMQHHNEGDTMATSDIFMH
eukprot:CAMPEP_0119328970 /NCGR_PEP_ID=MMETSP1333-20130426/74690_1 /TAXON_ID=418940 /ORGANISM="Scyphosphaera apsteinii, Strain RCC1455" /LENGTH=578 /DNA_ID=CAMNT_0007337969 /DNA_START=51 /DNA_END=1787 /DNA_ORIENTATION=-